MTEQHTDQCSCAACLVSRPYEEHPDDCDCDQCGYENHTAHVTIRYPGLREKVKVTQKPPAFQVGERVEYFRRGICYSGVIREDLGILRGAGRRYRITRDIDACQVDFEFEVAERWLSKPW